MGCCAESALEEARDEDLAAGRDVLRERLALDALLEVGREDAEHRRAALVQLEVELERADLRVREVAERVARAVVARVVRRRPDGGLHDAAEEEDLHEAEGGEREEARVAVGDRREGDALRRAERRARGRDVAGELEARVVHEHANNSDHRDAAVLALDRAPALKVLRLRLHETERVEETQRRGDAELLLRAHLERRARAARRGREGAVADERRGDAERKSEDRDALHDDLRVEVW